MTGRLDRLLSPLAGEPTCRRHLGVAVGFAALQFGLIIPATGGAERSDIVVNAAQIGESFRGVLGFVVLAWTGGVAEELFFRGHFIGELVATAPGRREPRSCYPSSSSSSRSA